MKLWHKVGLVVLSLYGIYWVKSALGINISDRYHAIDIVKLPVKAIIYYFNGLLS